MDEDQGEETQEKPKETEENEGTLSEDSENGGTDPTILEDEE